MQQVSRKMRATLRFIIFKKFLTERVRLSESGDCPKGAVITHFIGIMQAEGN